MSARGPDDPAWTRPALAALVGEPAGLAMLEVDATASRGVLERVPPGSLDVVVSWLALHRAPDPVSALRTARRALRPGGRLVAMIPHPVTTMPFHQVQRDAHGKMQALCIDRYFDGNPLEVWFGWIRDAGFALVDLREPVPTDEAVRTRPELAEATRVPYFLMFDLSRSP